MLDLVLLLADFPPLCTVTTQDIMNSKKDETQVVRIKSRIASKAGGSLEVRQPHLPFRCRSPTQQQAVPGCEVPAIQSRRSLCLWGGRLRPGVAVCDNRTRRRS